jgi:predicted nucleic acid-binding Zn ribbon protein
LTKSSEFAKNEDPMDTLSQILKRILSTNPELSHGVEEARILELWPEAVGESIARHSKAVQIKGTTLFISVEKPVWRQELHSNKSLVLQKLNRHLSVRLGQHRSGGNWIEEIFFLGAQNPTSSNWSKAGKPFRKK